MTLQATPTTGPGLMMTPVPLTWHTLLTVWQVSIFPVSVDVFLLFAAIWYVRSVWLLHFRGREWSKRRTLSFFSGLVVIAIATQSALVPLTMTHFEAHVIQHLLLMVTAPPLLALGAPSTLLLQTSSRATKTRWLNFLKSQPFAVASHPLVSFFLYFGVMTIFFLTPLINVAMHHEDLMDLMNVVFLVGATLYWWPMIGIDPIVHWKMTHGARMMNILFGSAVEAFLGIAIIALAHPIASMYSVNDTHAGGALLWVSTEFVTLAAFTPIYVQWYRFERRVARRADTALEHRHRVNNELEKTIEEMPLEERSLTPWELEWIARRGSAPQELRLSAEHLDASGHDS
jgi:putative copper resistance protein D